jgi:hypothetical protein
MPNLKDIKEGDFVALRLSSFDRDCSNKQVTRTTATRIYIGDVAYTRRGRRLGDTNRWGGECISVWDEESNGLLVARASLQRFAWDRVNRETADAVLAIINPKTSP